MTEQTVEKRRIRMVEVKKYCPALRSVRFHQLAIQPPPAKSANKKSQIPDAQQTFARGGPLNEPDLFKELAVKVPLGMLGQSI